MAAPGRQRWKWWSPAAPEIGPVALLRTAFRTASGGGSSFMPDPVGASRERIERDRAAA